MESYNYFWRPFLLVPKQNKHFIFYKRLETLNRIGKRGEVSMLVVKTLLLRYSSMNGDDGTMRFKQHLQSDLGYVCWQRYMHRYRHVHKHRHMYIGLVTLQHAYGQRGNMQHVYSIIQSTSVIQAVPMLQTSPAVSSVNLCKREGFTARWRSVLRVPKW